MPAPQRLTSLEATFLALSTPEVPFFPACVLELDRPLAYDALQARIEELLNEIPRYRQRIARAPILGSLAWVDDDEFSLDRHVDVLRVPAPGGRKELDEVVAKLLTAELPANHPPWRVWTVQGLAEGRGALIAVVHHALVDGIAGIGILERLLRLAPEQTKPAPRAATSPHERRRRPTALRFIERVSADLRGRAAAWRLLASQLQPRHHLPALYELLREGLTPSSALPGLTPGFRGNSRERTFTTFTVELDAIKLIKRAFGVTVNDVLLAVIAGSLRRYLVAHDVDTSRLDDVRAMIPVNRHARDEHATSGNRVALLLAHLFVDEPDAATRLRRISENTKTLKSHDIAGAGDMLVFLSDLTWSGVLANTFRLALWRRAYNIVVTNVPGPPVPLYLLDARVTKLVPIVNLWPGIPLAIAIGSYVGAVTLSIDADPAFIRDLEPFVRALELSFEELRAAVGPQTNTAPPAAAPHVS